MKSTTPYTSRVLKTKAGREPFNEWLSGLDKSFRARVRARIARVEMGNLGDCKAVGGVFELRVPVGPGLRVYFGMVNNLIVLLISGGDKSTQESDIKKAKELFDEFKETL